jgi:MFS family permease
MVTGSSVSSTKVGAKASVFGSDPPMAQPIPPESQAKDRRRSYADGAFFSVMVGFGESYLSAFALAIGRSQVSSGLLSTLPLVFGGVLQLVTPRLSRTLPGHRSWVVACTVLQALVYLPLVGFALLGSAPFPALFALVSLYWGFGMAGGAVWNNWIDAIVPRDRLARFFALRSRLTQLASFLAFLAAGLYLHYVDAGAKAFAALFAAALVARLVSAFCLHAQSDVTTTPDSAPLSPLPLSEALRRFLNPRSGRFILYILVKQVCRNLASPFFTPYMLARLQFSYAEYVAIVAGAYVSKIVFYPGIAAVVERLGAFRALWLSGLTVSVPPLLWFLTPQLWVLIALQVVAGFTWGIFELASTLLIFDRIRAEERIGILSLYNFLNACAVALGSAVGGLILARVDVAEGYPIIFSLSAAARLLSLLALVRAGMALAQVRGGVKSALIAIRTVTLRPGRDVLDMPVLGGKRGRKDRP